MSADLEPPVPGELDAAKVTDREREVLMLIAGRRTNAEIAAELFVSVRTAESHVSSLLSKLGCTGRRQLAAFAGPTIEADAPRARSLTTNVPASITSFVGRQNELRSIHQAQRTTRLLTITGPGGCGKTRLALEAARLAEASYTAGVRLAELGAVTDRALVDQAVAEALGVRFGRRRTPTDALVDFLAPRTLLLVLDNCEHVVDACAELVETLLVKCPDLHVLTTSREVLALTGETVWRVPPLTLPRLLVTDDGDLRGGEGTEDELNTLDSDAFQLFVHRAREQRPEFAGDLGSGTIHTIAEICRRLDGMPLAIELVAAQVGSLSVDEVASRLAGSFVLGTAVRTTISRHRTLRATLDWSHDLLSPPERRCLHRLAVLPGTFTIDAATAVVGDIDNQPIVDVLGALVRKSLLSTVERGDGLRYRLLEVTRQYAAEHLADTEAAAARDRHLAWSLDIAEQASGELRGAEPETWFARLDDERDNVRAALAWSLEQGATTAGLRLAIANGWYWHISGSAVEGLGWLNRLLAVVGPLGGADEAWRAAGILARDVGDYDRALDLFAACLQQCESSGDTAGAAKAINNVANVDWDRGEFSRAAGAWRRCLETFTEVADRLGVAIALNNLGVVAREQGNDEQSNELLERCRHCYGELGDREGLAGAVSNLGQLAMERGDHVRADQLYAESLEIRRRISHRHGIAIVLAQQAALDIRRGDFESADRRLDESHSTATVAGDRQRIAYARLGQADLATARDEPERAGELYKEALDGFEALGEPLGTARTLLGAGRNALVRGEHGEARANFVRCSKLCSRMGHKRGMASVLSGRAALARAEGEATSAESLDRQALQIYAEVHTPHGISAGLEGLGESAAIRGQMERAVVLIKAATALRRKFGLPDTSCGRERLNRVIDAARRQLGDDVMARARETAQALSGDSLVAAALRLPESGYAGPNP